MKIIVLIIIMLFSNAPSLIAQTEASGMSLNQLKYLPEDRKPIFSPFKQHDYLQYKTYHSTKVNNQNNLILIPIVFCAEKLPLFCKIEHHLDKKIKVPFRFRLGGIDYVNWLEGKNDLLNYTK